MFFRMNRFSPLRFGGPAPVAPTRADASIRVATWNLFFARQVERAIAIIQSDSNLAAADLIALQEADEAAAERMADVLGLGFVYYPALKHPRTRRHFGPALLSRWHVVDDARLDLPHAGLHRMPRIAVRATLQTDGGPLTVYAVHFGTMREVFPWQQAAQARQVLADASIRPGPAIIAGDLNRRGLGRLFEAAGWHWATRDVGRTHHVWSFDHVFVRGIAGPCRAGAVPAGLDASDHQAVWAAIGQSP
jgi:endonuclease/exonuclease/phosphatase family metal-dependent hydrolase